MIIGKKQGTHVKFFKTGEKKKRSWLFADMLRAVSLYISTVKASEIGTWL